MLKYKWIVFTRNLVLNTWKFWVSRWKFLRKRFNCWKENTINLGKSVAPYTSARCFECEQTFFKGFYFPQTWSRISNMCNTSIPTQLSIFYLMQKKTNKQTNKTEKTNRINFTRYSIKNFTKLKAWKGLQVPYKPLTLSEDAYLGF